MMDAPERLFANQNEWRLKPMDIRAIFGLQFFLSFIVWGAIAKWILNSWLDEKPLNEALSWLALPHAFRHIGMVFLVPGVVARALPPEFANPAAYGDLAAGALALLAFIALRTNWAGALALTWLFNVVGAVDLLYAVTVGTLSGAGSGMGAAWYIPTFLVPMLLVTHFMIFARLVRRND
jgi:hypothetical protein